MAFVFKDGASSSLVVAISNTETSMVLESVASFPQGMIAGDHTVVTISNSDNTLREVVKVTAINYTTKTLTAQRGYDSTIALNWPANSKVEIRAGSTLLKELGISYSPKVFLGKKVFPTSLPLIGQPNPPVIYHLNEDTSLDILNSDFRKYRIEIQNIYATDGNTAITIFPTVFTPEPRGTTAPLAGIYPRIINSLSFSYIPTSTTVGFTEARWLDSSTQRYVQTNFGGFPILAPTSPGVNQFDSIIDVDVQRLINNTNQPLASVFRIKMNISTTGNWNFNNNSLMYNTTYNATHTNVDNFGTPPVNPNMKLIGFSIFSPKGIAGVGGIDLPSATLYGIR